MRQATAQFRGRRDWIGRLWKTYPFLSLVPVGIQWGPIKSLFFAAEAQSGTIKLVVRVHRLSDVTHLQSAS